ncbi:CCR4-NOT core exoribonuclease subunit [Starmerella bacillaris]|uniref:CCR4-Not complex 3'-5'-exoribonuclease subunit Ccr4 n=1 Tax=Starmerella bacillaris TaxID=1247836 RepID=A0AAV5RLC3_STABA|nr:CCR4-NOT core exoribonuclease subunit [Starmerella bacillaris]
MAPDSAVAATDSVVAESTDDSTNVGLWNQQFQLAQFSRENSHPHSYARAAAVASKNTQMPILMAGDIALQMVRGEMASTNTSGEHATPARSTGANAIEKRERREEERQRHINEDINHQFWTALDFSGQGIRNISPKIVNYNFLQKLYLNHNMLTSIPKCITKLMQVRVLDLSGNQISEIPPEMGMMYNLRVLLLFDNHIRNIPAELGTLFQLQFLGIVGNPWVDENEMLKNVLIQEGTRGLVEHLRDKSLVDPLPVSRQWVEVDSVTKKENQISLMSYNTLCDQYATPQMYGYTPSWALNWDYRSRLLVEEVVERDMDIICLQEVNTVALETIWLPILTRLNYGVVFYAKTRARTMAKQSESKVVDGCATFYKIQKFQLIEKYPIEYNSKALLKDDLKKSTDIFNRVMTRDNIAILSVFESLDTHKQFLVANTHLHWDPALNDVKLVQTALLLEETEVIARKYARKNGDGDLKKVPVIIAGDFNSTAESGVVQLFNQSSVPAAHIDMEGHSYGNFTEHGIKHNLSLKSAYSEDTQLPFTNYTPAFVEVIDYIVYTTPTLKVNAVLGEVDSQYTKKYIGFPNAHHPSDHISIAARFELI